MKRVLIFLLALYLFLPAAQGEEAAVQRAYAFAPRTGKVSLRKTPFKSGTMLKTIRGGQIVEVLDANVSGFFTKVRFQGTEGYVSKALSFINYKPIATAILGPNGAVIYQLPRAEGVPAAQWPAGKKVQVYPWENWYYAGEWYEVESDGIHGFAMAADLSLNPNDYTLQADWGAYTVSIYANWTAAGHMNLDLMARLVELEDISRLNQILYYQVYANNVRLTPSLRPTEPHPYGEALYTGQVAPPSGTAVLGLCPVYAEGPRAEETIILRLDSAIP